MNKVSILLFSLTFLFMACQPEPKHEGGEDVTEEPAPPTEPTIARVPVPGALSPVDSAKVAEIEEYTQSVIMLKSHKDRGFDQSTHKPKGGHPKDNVHLVTNGGKVLRGVTSLFPDKGETRDYYFFREGEPVKYTHREWYFDVESPFAKEVEAYMESGRVITLEERRINLEKGQKPAAMLRIPLKESAMDRDSFLIALKANWKDVEKSIGRE